MAFIIRPILLLYLFSISNLVSQVLLWKSSMYDDARNPYAPSPIPYENDTILAPHIIAVRNALVKWDGQVFDASRHYVHGGCADFSWDAHWHRVPFEYINVLAINEPVINLNHPYDGNVFHELIEIYAQLISFKPVLDARPQTKVIMSSHLRHSKYFPLLALYGLNISAIRVHYLPSEEEYIYSPYVLTSVLGDCIVLMPAMARYMRSKIAKLPSRVKNAQKQILLYDRYNDKTRRMRYGDDIYEHMRTVFQPWNYTIVRFFGNESLKETVGMFSRSRLVLGAHGAGLVNMLFMHTNTTVVEVRPENYAVLVHEQLGTTIGLNYHVFLCGKGRAGGPIPVNPWQIVAYVKNIVLKMDAA
ncbi:glycosyltransferase family 61 protein [archaeon]|nr:MAG: glycosyltransferase family 61 protein [archaeon]